MATGIGNLPDTIDAVSPFDTIVSAWGNAVRNDIHALADGSGIGDGSVVAAAIDEGAVTAGKIHSTAITLGHQELTSNTSLTGTGYIDLSGLSITVTVPSGGRYIKVTGFAQSVSTTAAENVVALTLRDGSNTVLSSIRTNIRSGTIQSLGSVLYKKQLSAGTYTFKLSGTRDVNTGTTSIAGSATTPCFITAELV